MNLSSHSFSKYSARQILRRAVQFTRNRSLRFVLPAMQVLFLVARLTAQQPVTASYSNLIDAVRQVSDPELPSLHAEEFGPLAALSNGAGDSSTLPDDGSLVPQVPPKNAADAHATPKGGEDERSPQTKRILGVIPNFRAISTDQKLPPQSVKEKFVTATEDSFDYSSIVIPAVLAGYSMGTKATPEFGQGAVGYGRYFWHAAVDQTTENYMVEFVVPVLTREDTRYYTMGRGRLMKRAGYAASRVLITRSDAGREVFNLSEVVGAGGSAGLSSLYYPSRERSFGNTGKEWGLDLGIDALADVAKEFWPDINHWLSHPKKRDDSMAR